MSFGEFATALGKMVVPSTAPSHSPSPASEGRGSRGLTGPSNNSMSAAQFGKVANRTSDVVNANREGGLPSLGDPAYTPPDDVPTGLYS